MFVGRSDRTTVETSEQELQQGGNSPRWPLSRVILLASLIVGGVLRLWLAFSDDGIFWPDEIYQSLEPAHRAVFGYGLLAWEFIEGARHWTFPGLLAGILKLAQLAGVDSPRVYLKVIRVIFCAIGAGTALAIFRFARAVGVGKYASSCGSACFSLMSVAIYFAPRAMSESAAALAVTSGLGLCFPVGASRRQLWLGASVLGFAVLLRLQCGLFCLGLLAILIIRGARRPFVDVLLVLALWAFVFGLIDRLTWGHWFQSAIVYLRFNFFQAGAASFGRSPLAYYTGALLKTLGPLWVVIVLFALLALKRERELWGIMLLFFIPHWLSPHKEIRFLFPLFPLWCTLAAAGLQVTLDSKARWLRTGAHAAMLAAVVYSAATFRQLTFEKFRLRNPSPSASSAFDAGGPENRLLLLAHDAGDLCGLKVMTQELGYLGGFTYLHRRVPLYGPLGPTGGSRLFNYVIASGDAVAGHVLSEDSGLVLARIFEGSCELDSSYNWHLN